MLAHEEDLWEFERALYERLYRLFCPSSTDLMAFHQRRGNPDRYIVIANHLRECPKCRSELAILEELSHMPVFTFDPLPS
jgi:hypothetical protein